MIDNAKASATSAAAKATEINNKYKVTEKVSSGFVSGLNKVSEQRFCRRFFEIRWPSLWSFQGENGLQEAKNELIRE